MVLGRMEEKPSASIKPYLDKLTLGVTRILGERLCGGAPRAWGGGGSAGGGGDPKPWGLV